jgi:hypothetical protein
MRESRDIEKKSMECLTSWLASQGRKVARSDNKTFDLIVDGQYAGLKTKRRPYEKFNSFYMTENQYTAIANGPPYILFLVCNVDDPENAQIMEFTSAQLATLEAKREIHYFLTGLAYWDKGLVEKLRSGAN